MENNKIYFTLVGEHLFNGHSILEKGMGLTLVKNPNNEYDPETIEIKVAGLGQIGYVANSVTTRKGVSYSAGRLVDKIENNTCATIEYVLSYGAICSLKGEVVNG